MVRRRAPFGFPVFGRCQSRFGAPVGGPFQHQRRLDQIARLAAAIEAQRELIRSQIPDSEFEPAPELEEVKQDVVVDSVRDKREGEEQPVVIDEIEEIEEAVGAEEDSDDELAAQLETLDRMGFKNGDLNRLLLSHNEGDILKTMEILLSLK